VLDVFRERGSYDPRVHPLYAWRTIHLPDGGWGSWVRNPPRIHWVDGDHWTIVKAPQVHALAKTIRTAMDERLSSDSV
jgi:thioesterase domain-containing protein